MTAQEKTVLLPEPIEDEARRLLEQGGVRILQSPDAKPETVKPLLAQADAVVLRTGIRMSAELIECGNRLAAISRTGAGFDNVDVDSATRQGVIVSSSVGANTHTVAEHTLALILALAKQLPALDRETRAGNFRIRYSYLPRDLRGAVLGAVGFGRIGREVASACATVFGMKVLAFDAYLPPAAKERDASWVRFCELEELLENADVVTIHVPLTGESEGLIDARRIARMKKGALIVNTSRGGIIDEAALADALVGGKLGGAGIDVFSREPPLPANPLLAATSALLTPHAAALTGECVQRMAVCAAQRVLDLFNGFTPENIANPEVLKKARWSRLTTKERQQT
jgi:D-3-phosphoglycerate dehydrogenase / 2-oxoglutarate reductase